MNTITPKYKNAVLETPFEHEPEKKDDTIVTSITADEATDELPLDLYQQVIIDNDHILFDLTSHLKEKYELKGFLNQCNMNRLIDIFYNNLIVEDFPDVDLEEDEFDTDEEFFNF